MDKDMISAKYDQQVRNQQVGKQGEDFSDLVADHTARQKVSYCNSLFKCLSPCVNFWTTI